MYIFSVRDQCWNIFNGIKTPEALLKYFKRLIFAKRAYE